MTAAPLVALGSGVDVLRGYLSFVSLCEREGFGELFVVATIHVSVSQGVNSWSGVSRGRLVCYVLGDISGV